MRRRASTRTEARRVEGEDYVADESQLAAYTTDLKRVGRLQLDVQPGGSAAALTLRQPN